MELTVILDDKIYDSPELGEKLYNEYWLGMRTSEAPGSMHISPDGTNGRYKYIFFALKLIKVIRCPKQTLILLTFFPINGMQSFLCDCILVGGSINYV